LAYDDVTKTHAELRAKWLATGAPWFSFLRPAAPEWDALTSLNRAGLSEKQHGTCFPKMTSEYTTTDDWVIMH
jgi:hypothetical protein